MSLIVNTEDLDRILASENKPVVIKFFATWCGPCKMFAPIFESAAAKAGDRAIFVESDIDQAPELVERYGIMNVPSVVMVKGGEVVHKSSGIMNEPSLLALLDK